MPRNDLVRGDARPTEPPRAATGALGPIQILIRVGLAVAGVCGIVALIYHLKKEKKLWLQDEVAGLGAPPPDHEGGQECGVGLRNVCCGMIVRDECRREREAGSSARGCVQYE